MDKRRSSRTRKRISCTLVVEGGRHGALVLDVSAHGLFVQTTAMPAAGAMVAIELHLPEERLPVRIDARVARRQTVPPRLRSLVKGGLALEIANAPEAFFRFLAELQETGMARGAAGRGNARR